MINPLGTSSAGAKMCGLGIWSDPTATGNTFDTSLKQGFRAVSGSRVSIGSLTESAFRGLLQSVYTASGSKGSFRLFAGPALVNKITDYTRSTTANSDFNFNQDVKDGILKLSVVTYISVIMVKSISCRICGWAEMMVEQVEQIQPSEL